MIDTGASLPDILRELIGCPSVTEREEILCDLLEETLAGKGGRLAREGNSLILHRDSGCAERIALVGHIDTVPVGGSTTEAYVKEGSLYGRGACDMKAGLAVMLKILDDLESDQLTPRYNLSFVFYDGEEGPVPNGINSLLEKGHFKGVDFAFILEPTESLYSVGCLGSLAVRKEVLGVSAHSANPRTGVNALERAMDIFRKIGDMDREIGETRFIDGLPYYETVNVTALNTFNAFNVLPPRAELVINYRFSPELSLGEASEKLYSRIGEEGVTILDAVGSAYGGNAIEGFLKQGIKREIMQAWTDMAQLIDAGIPAINFGPGSIRHAHKPDERISLKELEDFYVSLSEHLAGS